jgi:hypothetical protein
VKPRDANEEYVAEVLARREAAPPGSETTEKSGMDRRLANLKPFPPGVSGNPHGPRVGSVSLRRILMKKLAEIPEGSDRRTMAEQLVDSTCKAALKGDAQARKLIWESIEGAARQQINVSAREYIPPEIDEATMIAYADEALAVVLEAELRANLRAGSE